MKNIVSTLLLLFCAITGIAQSLSINSDGSTANPSAMLDVKSTSKGLLIPRLTSAQRIAISGPAIGLEVYDADLNQFYFYNGSSWTPVAYGANANNFWTLSGGNIYNNTGANVGIGAVVPLAKLTVEGTDDAGPQDLFKLSKVNYGSTIFYQYYTDAGNWGTKMRGSSGPAPGFLFNMVNARFGIGTSAPAANLDVIGTVKITDGSQGLNKVFISDANGLGSWVSLSAASVNAWGLTGNSGTVDGTNFIGTTDNIPFNILVNNQKAARIDHLLNNSFYGYRAGNATTSGIDNTATGLDALFTNTTGTNNTANGFYALRNNTGNYNTAIGSEALYFNTTGINNSSAGGKALFSNTSGYSNVAMGKSALYSNTTQSNLIAVGDSALFNNGIGATQTYHASANTAIGSKALYSNTTGYANTSIGYHAGYNVSTGNANVFLGYYAGYNELGSNKLYIANDSTVTPLIGGDFSTKIVTINNILTLAPTSTPSSPVKGMIYFDVGTNKLRVFDGTIWHDLW